MPKSSQLELTLHLAGVEMSLINVGLDIKPGSGVGAAIEYWADTSKVIPTRKL